MDDSRDQEEVGREKGQECAQAGRVGGDRRMKVGPAEIEMGIGGGATNSDSESVIVSNSSGNSV
jgi:hypothetical protein